MTEAKRPDTFYSLRYPDRLLCTVLEEMRQCVKTLNFAGMTGLIEEAQALGNRMEAGLERKKAVADGDEYVHALKAEIKELEAARDALKSPTT